MSSNTIYYMTFHSENIANDNRCLLIRFITQLSMGKYSQQKLSSMIYYTDEKYSQQQ